MKWLPFLILAQSLNLNVTPIETRQDGVRVPQRVVQRQYAVDCRSNMTCGVDGGVLYLSAAGAAGGSGAPVDGGYLTITAGSTGSSNERVLTAGTNITLDSSAPGTVVVNASGGGSANFSADSAAFAATPDALKSVDAGWATPSSSIICSAADEEGSIESVQFTVTTRGTGSYVVRAQVPVGTHTGSLAFTCTGN